MTLKTPDITLAQKIGLVLAALQPLLTLAGVHLSHTQVDALQNLQHDVVALFGADALIRVGRAVSVKKSS